ncbi:MAG TPA: hypothetical protein VJT82_00395 [Pyrinomonadaceae bacterium]|nr:hypothetical protein [Pyrinomonadaceae bacterium]
MEILTLCFVSLLLAGAQVVGGANADVNANACASQTIDVRVGREINVPGQRLKIKFVAVREDSRCPVGVTCVWAGNARVALKLTKARMRAVDLELNTATTEPQEGDALGYQVRLAKLVPHPVNNQKLNPRDYVATLAVTKKS